MNVCVYGAASDEIDDSFIRAGEALGKTLAGRGAGLVFGGGAHGMMGAAARGAHSMGGFILGVAPRFFDRPGVLYEACTEFVFTETIRERKQYMEDNSDAFIVTPGGIGTMEEFFEMLTLKTLDRTQKPIVLYNVNGYYDPLRQMLQVSAAQGFLRPEDLSAFLITDDPDEILRYIMENV